MKKIKIIQFFILTIASLTLNTNCKQSKENNKESSGSKEENSDNKPDDSEQKNIKRSITKKKTKRRLLCIHV